MGELSRFEILLLAVTAFVAFTSLVNLMRARRDWLVAQVQEQLTVERERRRRQRKKREQSGTEEAVPRRKIA